MRGNTPPVRFLAIAVTNLQILHHPGGLERKSRRFEEQSPSDRKKYIEPVKWSPLENVSRFLNDGAKKGHEDLALRAGLTAGAAPSPPGGKVC